MPSPATLGTRAVARSHAVPAADALGPRAVPRCHEPEAARRKERADVGKLTQDKQAGRRISRLSVKHRAMASADGCKNEAERRESMPGSKEPSTHNKAAAWRSRQSGLPRCVHHREDQIKMRILVPFQNFNMLPGIPGDIKFSRGRLVAFLKFPWLVPGLLGSRTERTERQGEHADGWCWRAPDSRAEDRKHKDE